jgi:hypothetical protein
MRPEKATLAARGLLWLGVILLIIAQFAGPDESRRLPVWSVQYWSSVAIHIMAALVATKSGLQMLLTFAAGVSSVMVLIGTPWLVRILGHYRTSLWILRFLMTVLFALLLSRALWVNGLKLAVDVKDVQTTLWVLKYWVAMQPGYLLYVSAVGANAAGLWLIPRAQKAVASASSLA